MAEYASKDIANIVGIKPSTVRRYAQALEEAGYQFTKDDNDSRGTRIYFDEDIYFFQEMNKQSEETKVPIKSIAAMLVSQQKRDAAIKETAVSVSDMLQPNEVKTSESLQDIPDYQVLIQQFETSTEKVIQEKLDKQKEELTQELTQKFKREERSREMTARWRAENKLRQEALKLWSKKPKEERMIKTGWFRKEEDQNKKELFIIEYINKHFEDQIREELGMEN